MKLYFKTYNKKESVTSYNYDRTDLTNNIFLVGLENNFPTRIPSRIFYKDRHNDMLFKLTEIKISNEENR
jgi:hypothetical protein